MLARFIAGAQRQQIVCVSRTPPRFSSEIHDRSEWPAANAPLQTGSYLGEDDIVRIEDDYRRS
jgi:hypothetical protein